MFTTGLLDLQNISIYQPYREEILGLWFLASNSFVRQLLFLGQPAYQTPQVTLRASVVAYRQFGPNPLVSILKIRRPIYF